MASLLGTLGTIGSSLLGDLFSKGVKTLGDVASNKMDNWKKQNTGGSNISNKRFKQLDGDIKQLQKRVNTLEQSRNMDEE